MNAVLDTATQNGWPEKVVKNEYFLLPEDKSAVEAILDAGVHIDVRCANGICGVCSCGLAVREFERY